MMLSGHLVPSPPLPKRTRVGVRQSKNGCFTCKARRIKCDEQKPSCLRCSRSHKICEGYLPEPRNEAIEKDYRSQPIRLAPDRLSLQSIASKPHFPLQYSLYDGFRRSSEQHRLSQLGCQVLAYNKYGERLNSSRSILDYLLPQLSHAIPSVNSAAAAVGAVYERLLLTKSTDQSKLAVESQYNLALRIVRQDIARQPHGSIPLLLACMLLGCAESLQHHYSNAMAHLRGAFGLFTIHHESIPRMATPDVNSQGHSTLKSEERPDTLPQDGFAFLFRSLDTHRPSYAVGRPPDLPILHFNCADWPLFTSEDLGTLSMQLIPVIHSCYHFIAKASDYRYSPQASLLPEILIEQGRRIAELSLWLETFDRNLNLTRSTDLCTSSSGDDLHAMMLRVQCLVMIITVSTTLSPCETDYDSYASYFQQIVENSAAAAGGNQHNLGGLGQFSAGPGINHPLFFTALKFRHSELRRKAIKLLREAGREGPWDGQLLAVVATRAMEIEEACWDSKDSDADTSINIPESDRLRGCSMDIEAGGGKAVVRVTFRRFYRVGKMPTAKELRVHGSNCCEWDEDLNF